jgi:nanoRNase/pAp phosphatase (c-di-AMP/oligoRNAs hydrolase)
MDTSANAEKIKELVGNASDILILTHERPTPDSIGSALALYLGLVGLGKRVSIVCPDPMTVEFSSFVGVNKVMSELGRKNFVISLDYIEGSIEKVSYNIEGDTFNLVIEPRAGFDTFNADKVHYSYGGVSADLLFTVDTIHLGGLKKLYEDEKEFFAGKPIINIDRHPNNANYGQINVVDATSSSTAELVAQLLTDIDIVLTQDIATNLLNAVIAATNSFQAPNVTPAAFEVTAKCLRAGGKRFGEVSLPQTPPAQQPKAPQPKVQIPTPLVPDQPAPIEVADHQNQAPADWLKPKIFKSSKVS